MKSLFLSIFLIFLSTSSVFADTPLERKKFFKVLSVIDGDTINVLVRGNKETIRLLGIDSPETKDPRKPVECFGEQAYQKMKQFAAGKYVKLVDDRAQGNRDKYRRLLRYVYLENGTFVNAEMVKQGYAFSYKKYPTVYIDKFNKLEKETQDKNLGLWDSCQNNTNFPTPTFNVIKNSNNSYICNCAKSCSEISSCDEAYFQLNNCGCYKRDGDGDGIPCESLCR